MPIYKNSKSQSKNGGRRRKQTKRKLRRGRKSRKVMRGGENKVIQSKTLSDMLNSKGLMTFFLERYAKVQSVSLDEMRSFDEFETHYNQRFDNNDVSMKGVFGTQELMLRMALKKDAKSYEQNKGDIIKLGDAILILEW